MLLWMLHSVCGRAKASCLLGTHQRVPSQSRICATVVLSTSYLCVHLNTADCSVHIFGVGEKQDMNLSASRLCALTWNLNHVSFDIKGKHLPAAPLCVSPLSPAMDFSFSPLCHFPFHISPWRLHEFIDPIFRLFFISVCFQPHAKIYRLCCAFMGLWSGVAETSLCSFAALQLCTE